MSKLLNLFILSSLVFSSLLSEAELLSNRDRFYFDTARYMDKKKKKLSASYFYSEYLKSSISKKDSYKKRYTAYRYITEQLGVKGGEALGIESFRYLPFTESLYHEMRGKLSQKNANEILKKYSKLKSQSVQHPGLLHLVASSHYLSGDLDRALSSYKECLSLRKKFSQPYYSQKFEYQTNLDQCQLGEARILYEKKEYQKAYESYLKIPKSSIYYAASFVEKSWVNYQLNRFDKVLGYATAFQSKELIPYYDGEVEILASLSFVQNCHWDNAFDVFKNLHSNVDQYIRANQKIKKRVEKFVSQYINSGEVAKDLEEILVKKHFKTPFWIINREVVLKAEAEINNLDKKNPYYMDLRLFMEKLIVGRTNGLQNYLIKKLERHTQKMKDLKIKSDMIEMEVLARMRKELYSRKVDLKKIASSKKQTFKPSFNYTWSFNGNYWKDELDKISIPVESKCSPREIASEKK